MNKKMTNRQLALNIVRKLRDNGFQAYFAGGCVRDMLLGIRPKDYDVATDAHPEQVSQIFPRTLKVGAKFGVVMVMHHKIMVEVATFRTETGYHDGRHPDSVEFASLKEDAIRRDFTINGLYYDPVDDKVIDHVNGQKDIKAGIIRAIGDPEKRFSEDYLRMLRAVRFGSRFKFDIDGRTLKAIKHHAPKIRNISRERISIELEGILTHPNRQMGVSIFIDSKLASEIFHDHDKKKKKKIIELFSHFPRDIDFALGLAGFFLYETVDLAMYHCHALRLSRNQLKHIRFLLENFSEIENPDLNLAQLKMLVSQPYFEDLFTLRKAYLVSNGLDQGQLRKLRRRVNSLAGKQLRPKPLLDGHELIALGVRPGPQVGHVSRELYIAQLCEDVQNKAQARNWVENWQKKHENPQ